MSVRQSPAWALLLWFTAYSSATVLYVDDDAPVGGDGSAWTTAFRYLQDALAAAAPGDELRVAQGIYLPDRSAAFPDGTGNRDVSFVLVSGVTLRGGFAGLGAPEPDARDAVAWPTVLSGDLAGNDQPAWVNHSENSRHVVVATGAAPGTQLDGVQLAGGYAEWSTGLGAVAGALYLSGGNLELVDCRLADSLAHLGGAAYVTAGTLRFTRCTFTGNYAWTGRGGALYLAAGADVQLRACAFLQNDSYGASSVGDGGAIFDESGTTLSAVGCLFRGNSSTAFQPPFSNGGAICHLGPGLTLINCVFQDNDALVGGALWIGGAANVVDCVFAANSSLAGGAISTFMGNVTMTNCTLFGNHADDGGGIFNGSNSQLTIVNAILWGNTAVNYTTLRDAQLHNADNGNWDATYSCVQGLFDAEPGEDPPDPANFPGCIVSPPQFTDPEGPDNWLGNEDDDLRLAAGSPCIDAGDNAALPPDSFDTDGDGNVVEPLARDVRGAPRQVDDPAAANLGSGVPPLVDMGAYERQIAVPGDLNCDGAADFGDINPFVLALSNAAAYAAAFPGCDPLQGDINNDGVLNFGDINPLVTLLSS